MPQSAVHAGAFDAEAIINPVLTVGPSFRRWATALGGVVAWALFAWVWQLTHGLGSTHLGRPVYWGLYITNFVFFIGVSHAGTLEPPAPADPDQWVKSRTPGKKKRLTFAIPLELHARMKVACARRGTSMVAELEALLEKHYPPEER